MMTSVERNSDAEKSMNFQTNRRTAVAMKIQNVLNQAQFHC